MTEYTLPDLPYDYSAREPHIAGEIMELHHDKHHATYVKGANTALEQLAAARDCDALATVNMLERNPRSTSAVTSTTRCSGPTCLPTAATSPTAPVGREETSCTRSTCATSIRPGSCRASAARFPAGAHRRCRAEASCAMTAAARHQISLERLLYPGTQCACS